MNLQKIVIAAATIGIATAYLPAEAAHSDRSFRDAGDSAEHRHDGDRRKGRRHGLRHKVNRIFSHLDTDGNEIITLDEYLAKPTEKAEHQFNRIDTDDDGLISLDEFLAIQHGRGHDRPDRPDVDRDAVRQCVADALGTDIPERPDRESRFDAVDTNDDGYIDLDEFLRARVDGATEKFNKIDADSDGGITKEELAEALQHVRDRRHVRRDCIEQQQETDELLDG